MNYSQGETLKTVKKKQIQVAKELCYGDAVITKIQNAKSEMEIDRIMVDERRRDKKR